MIRVSEERVLVATAASSSAQIGASPEPAARNRAGSVEVGSLTNVPYGLGDTDLFADAQAFVDPGAGLPVGDAGDQQ